MEHENSGFTDLRFASIETLKPGDRILKTAIALFNEYGIHTIGIDRIIAESGISKRTFYSYYPSKNDLIAAYLDFWDAYRFSVLEKHLAGVQGGAKAELLALFDALEDWITDSDFNGCVFTRGLNDFKTEELKNLHLKIDQHFERGAEFIKERLARLVKPGKAKAILAQLLSLVVGAMVVAHATGDTNIAQLNKKIAIGLLENEEVLKSGGKGKRNE